MLSLVWARETSNNDGNDDDDDDKNKNSNRRCGDSDGTTRQRLQIIKGLEKKASGSKIKTIGTDSSLSKTTKNFTLLCWRAWTQQRRDVITLKIKFIFSCVFGLILGGIYSNQTHNQTSIQNRIGILFFITINQVSRLIFLKRYFIVPFSFLTCQTNYSPLTSKLTLLLTINIKIDTLLQSFPPAIIL